jgi:tRNA threonylcarbamoyladenosine biosynthesis protein TsaE
VTREVSLGALEVQSEEKMHRFGLALAQTLRGGDLVILDGPLGAGKTTLTRAVAEGLGVIGTVSSPTFVIARTHKRTAATAPVFVHVDAYRLTTAGEFDDLDIDFANSIVFVEWGRGFADDITDSWLDIQISRSAGESETRTVTLTGYGDRFANAQTDFAELIASVQDGGAA